MPLTSATPAAISAAVAAAFETFCAVRLALDFTPGLPPLLDPDDERLDCDDELFERDEALFDFDDEPFLRVVDPALLDLRRFLELEAVSDVTFFTGGLRAYVDELFFFGISTPQSKEVSRLATSLPERFWNGFMSPRGPGGKFKLQPNPAA